jgi:hypothetical protein
LGLSGGRSGLAEEMAGNIEPFPESHGCGEWADTEASSGLEAEGSWNWCHDVFWNCNKFLETAGADISVVGACKIVRMRNY